MEAKVIGYFCVPILNISVFDILLSVNYGTLLSIRLWMSTYSRHKPWHQRKA